MLIQQRGAVTVSCPFCHRKTDMESKKQLVQDTNGIHLLFRCCHCEMKIAARLYNRRGEAINPPMLDSRRRE